MSRDKIKIIQVEFPNNNIQLIISEKKNKNNFRKEIMKKNKHNISICRYFTNNVFLYLIFIIIFIYFLILILS